MSKQYSPELKAIVVAAILDEYRTIDDVESEFQIPRGTFGGWVSTERRVRRDRADRIRAVASAPVSRDEAKRLRDENLILREGFSAMRSLLVAMENALEE